MPTICGLRRRGYTPEAIRAFAERVGVAKRDMTAEVGLLEACIRECLEASAPRRMAVLHPLRLTVTNFVPEQTFDAELPNHPEKPEMGSRKLPFSGELWIEQEDFMEDPPKKWHRLSLGAEVRLRGACIVKCNEVVKDNVGNVIELRCTWDENSKGGNAADGRKIKGTIHWVSAAHAIDAEVRLYGQLFQPEDPMALPEGQDWRQAIDSNSLEIAKAKLEPSLAGSQTDTRFQFERAGYFALDPDSQPSRPIFNRVVGLKDSWAKMAGGK